MRAEALSDPSVREHFEESVDADSAMSPMLSLVDTLCCKDYAGSVVAGTSLDNLILGDVEAIYVSIAFHPSTGFFNISYVQARAKREKHMCASVVEAERLVDALMVGYDLATRDGR